MMIFISEKYRITKNFNFFFRSATKLETKDVQYVLARKYKIFLPAQPVNGVVNECIPSKSPLVEAHRQRTNLIKKVLQKP